MLLGRYIAVLRSHSGSLCKSDRTRFLRTWRGTIQLAYQQRTQFPSWWVLQITFSHSLIRVCIHLVSYVHAGGLIGFDKVKWEGRKVMDTHGPSVQFTYHSHDGEQGTPCNPQIHPYMTVMLPSEETKRYDSWFILFQAGNPRIKTHNHELTCDASF